MHERTTVSPVLFCFPACVVFLFHTSVIRKELRYAYTTGETTDITNSLDLSSFIAYIRHELEEEGHGVGLVAHVSIVWLAVLDEAEHLTVEGGCVRGGVCIHVCVVACARLVHAAIVCSLHRLFLYTHAALHETKVKKKLPVFCAHAFACTWENLAVALAEKNSAHFNRLDRLELVQVLGLEVCG